jgi:hypothetical protein
MLTREDILAPVEPVHVETFARKLAARVACRIAQAGARDSNAALAACLATARRDA